MAKSAFVRRSRNWRSGQGGFAAGSSKTEEQRLSKIYNHGSDPEKWIFGDDSGFEDICRYVGLNPDHARANLRRQSTAGDAY